MVYRSTMYVAARSTPELTRARLEIDKFNSIKSYVLISQSFKSHKSLISDFPDISFIEYGISSSFFASQKIRPIKQFPQILDEVISDSVALMNLLLMSIRFSPNPTSTNQSLALVLSTLQLATSILDKERPDNIFFPVTPHDVFTYSIYLVAKNMSIPCKISKVLASINDSKAFNISDIYDPVPWQSMLGKISIDNSSVTENIESLTSRCLTRAYKTNTDSSFLSLTVTKSIIFMKTRKFLYKVLSMIGLNKYRYFEYQEYSLSSSSIFERLSKEQKNEKKLLFLALQYQPEVTSVPMTRPWFTTDQLILFISTYLPKDWVLIVKEHPTMYNWHVGSTSYFRSNTLYEMITGLSNVILAPYNLKSSILISYSNAVITGTGSVGTEAICNGKPVISLGNAPCLGLPYVYAASTFSELSRLLSRLDSIIDTDSLSFTTAKQLIAQLSNLPPNPELQSLQKVQNVDEFWMIPHSSSFNSDIT